MAETMWLQVAVDEDGRMQVRDVVDDLRSDWYETVGTPPSAWVEQLTAGVRAVMAEAGLDLQTDLAL